MASAEQNKAVLLLEDGTVFYGFSIGKIGITGGEICFNTGMTGYQEIYTDPSYFGQIVINTTAHIGNYGVFSTEVESEDIKIRGLVVRNFSHTFSRNRADSSLQDYLQKAGIIGISNVDTRALVRHVRSKGAMNAVISSQTTDLEELKSFLASLPSMEGLELSSKVSTKEAYFVGDPEAAKKVAVLDVGVKKSILTNLVARGCYVKVFNAYTSFEQMQEFQPDGYFISNGPGDPSSMDYAIDTVKKIIQSQKPVFGICLGHQLIALASGISTYKMHNGHRGLNHPVKNLETQFCEITSQNHGFAVNADDVNRSSVVKATHINLNDQTIAGIRLLNAPVFSVQYHPESSPGPHDSRYLFDNFVSMMN